MRAQRLVRTSSLPADGLQTGELRGRTTCEHTGTRGGVAATGRRVAGAEPFARASDLPATGWLVAAPPYDSRHRPTTATSPDNQQRFREVAAKKCASACKTLAASPSTPRNRRSRAQLATEIKQSEAHPSRGAHARAFFGSRFAKPLSNSRSSHRPDPDSLPTIFRHIDPSKVPASNPPGHRPNPDPLASTSPTHRPEPTLLPTTLQTVRPKSAPYQQPFRPSDRPRPLTNAPPSHRPDAEGPHDATPYCACATPSPSGAPTGQGPLPLCAQHHPSSIRS